MKFSIFGNNQSGKNVFEKAIKFSNLVKVDNYITLGDSITESYKSESQSRIRPCPLDYLVPHVKDTNWVHCPRDLKPYGVQEIENTMFISLNTKNGTEEQINFIQKNLSNKRWENHFKIILIDSIQALIGHNNLYNECVDNGAQLIITNEANNYSRGHDEDTIVINCGGCSPELKKQNIFNKLPNQKVTITINNLGIMSVYEETLQLTFYSLEDYRIIDSFNVWKN